MKKFIVAILLASVLLCGCQKEESIPVLHGDVHIVDLSTGEWEILLGNGKIECHKDTDEMLVWMEGDEGKFLIADEILMDINENVYTIKAKTHGEIRELFAVKEGK